jgi:hypothetical protein
MATRRLLEAVLHKPRLLEVIQSFTQDVQMLFTAGFGDFGFLSTERQHRPSPWGQLAFLYCAAEEQALNPLPSITARILGSRAESGS